MPAAVFAVFFDLGVPADDYFTDKCIKGAAAESCLRRARGGRKVARNGLTGDVSIARFVHRDALARIEIASAQVAGVQQCRAAAVQLADKRIEVAAESGLQRACANRKIARTR
jgi:hypothetical protein